MFPAAESLVAFRRKDYSRYYRIQDKIFSPHNLSPQKIIGVKSKHLTFGLRHNGPEINTDEDGIMRGNGAADYVESQVLQLFEADATLESPAVCSAI